MQTPDANLEKFTKLEDALQESEKREQETGKFHPVFSVGEELEIKGGKFRVHRIAGKRLILKPIKY